MKRIHLLVFLASVSVLLLAACSSGANPSQSGYGSSRSSAPCSGGSNCCPR